MNRPLDLASWQSLDRETVLQPRPQSAEPVKVCCPKREIAGSGPHLTGETSALLRYRLRAAAAILLVGFGVFLARHIGGVIAGEPLDVLLLSAHVLVVLVLSLSLLPLCRGCPQSIRKHRIAELVIFALPAAFF